MAFFFFCFIIGIIVTSVSATTPGEAVGITAVVTFACFFVGKVLLF